jgi:alanine racemase
VSKATAGLQTWLEVHLDRLEHNLRLLAEIARGRPLWPVIKSNAYGHGVVGVARALVDFGYDTLSVARVSEALELVEAGLRSRIVLLSPCLPEEAETVVTHGFEPSVCRRDTLDALSAAAEGLGRPVAVHVKVDTGMGRTGLQPDEVHEFLDHCGARPGVRVIGLMSHFPRADEGDATYSLAQVERFRGVVRDCAAAGITWRHMANSAALFDVPDSRFDAIRPGIAIYGLRPSPQISHPRANELRPVLEWKSRITFLKEVPAGTGISYGHSFHTSRPSLVATVPVGYGDGLSRLLSDRMEVLVDGVRCPQIGRITMDQFMVDVSALRGRAQLGAEVVLIGRQAGEEASADVLAATLGTINYEIVTIISPRLPRIFAPGR